MHAGEKALDVTRERASGSSSVGASARVRKGSRAARAAFSALFVGSLAGGVGSTGCIFSRMFYYNVPDLTAPTYFDNHAIESSPRAAPLKRDPVEAYFGLTREEAKRYRTFDDLLEKNETRAFLVLQDDRIVYERYFGGIGPTTSLPGFSMTKSVAALTIGCALSDGLFTSPEQPISELVPELKSKEGYRDITIDQLLRMTAGIDFDEESIPGAMLYYSQDLQSRTYLYDVKWKPGTHYLYGSVSVQILWDALHRRLGGRSVASYFQERVWARLGAVDPASWSVDSRKHGVEKFFGGFNATARDHARFGMLFLHGGSLNGESVIPESWVTESVTPDAIAGVVKTTDGFVQRGKYQWFLTTDGRAYFAKGYHGQYVFVVPAKKMVFVRFAEGYGDINWPQFFLRLADAH